MNTKTLGLFSLITLFFCCRVSAQIYDTNGDFVQTFVGSGIPGYLDGQGQATEFSSPSQIVADTASNLYVWDSGNHVIRKITPSGAVSTFVGGGSQLEGYGTNVTLSSYTIGTLSIDHSNTLWANVTGSYLLSISSTGDVLIENGSLSNLSVASGLCFDSANNLYYSGGYRIYRYNVATASAQVFAGSGVGGHLDGNGIFTEFNGPGALVCDQANNIYVADSGQLRKIDQNLNVTTLTNNLSGTPMAVDNLGNVLCSYGYGGYSYIFKITATTNFVFFAGTTAYSAGTYTNGPGNLARFDSPSSACLSQGSIFVADTLNQRIRQISFNPVAQPVTGPNLGVATYAGITITGMVGRSYQIQGSTNMTTWSTSATLLLTSSPYLWFDTSGVAGRKFYRAFLMP